MKNKLVVDSSVIVKWLNRQDEEFVDEADRILADVQMKGVVLMAPELAKYEVGNALLNKGMELPQAMASLGTIYSLPIQFVSQDEDQALKTIEIATQLKITYYDASFLSLARQNDAGLVTDNPKHQKKFEGVEVISLRDYR